MNRFFKCFLLSATFIACFFCLCAPVTAHARANETPYPRREGWYGLDVYYRGNQISSYTIKVKVGADRNDGEGSSWFPTTVQHNWGTDCLTLTNSPYSSDDGNRLVPTFRPWNRQYYIWYWFDVHGDFMKGHHISGLGTYDNATQIHCWVMGQKTIKLMTDTNDIGISNWGVHYPNFNNSGFKLLIDPDSFNLWFHTNNPNGNNDVHIDRESQAIYYGSPYGGLPVPTKNGYVFDGWWSAPDGGTRITEGTVCGDDVLNAGEAHAYAHWRPIEYTINFLPNRENGTGEVSGTMDSIRLAYDELGTLLANQYAKTTLVPAEDEGSQTWPSLRCSGAGARTPTPWTPPMGTGRRS